MLAWQLRPCYALVGRCKSLVVDRGDALSKDGLVAGRSASRFQVGHMAFLLFAMWELGISLCFKMIT